jgi:hypothetical protein
VATLVGEKVPDTTAAGAGEQPQLAVQAGPAQRKAIIGSGSSHVSHNSSVMA